MKTLLTISETGSVTNNLKENATAYTETKEGLNLFFNSKSEAKQILKKEAKFLSYTKSSWFCIPNYGTYIWKNITEKDVENSIDLQEIYR